MENKYWESHNKSVTEGYWVYDGSVNVNENVNTRESI